MTWDALPTDRLYRCVVIDPPWEYDDALPGPARGAGKHYDGLMAMTDILTLPLDRIVAPECHVWLWYTNSFLIEAGQLLTKWAQFGLRPKTQLTWCKEPGIGMGHYLRNTTEHAVLATRSRTVDTNNPRNIPSHFVAPRGKHSRKPDEAYDIIRQVSPGPYLDVFARSPRESFDRFGNELLQWDGVKYVVDARHFIAHDDNTCTMRA